MLCRNVLQIFGKKKFTTTNAGAAGIYPGPPGDLPPADISNPAPGSAPTRLKFSYPAPGGASPPVISSDPAPDGALAPPGAEVAGFLLKARRTQNLFIKFSSQQVMVANFN